MTHLPQLAGYGDQHLYVHKRIVGDRTVTEVERLQDSGRERELAGMLGTITEKTQASAREMLIASQEDKDGRIRDQFPMASPGVASS